MADAIRTMQARDVISARMASCYVTINGERILLLQAKTLEARVEKKKVEVPILGKSGLGHKTTTWNGTVLSVPCRERAVSSRRSMQSLNAKSG